MWATKTFMEAIPESTKSVLVSVRQGRGLHQVLSRQCDVEKRKRNRARTLQDPVWDNSDNRPNRQSTIRRTGRYRRSQLLHKPNNCPMVQRSQLKTRKSIIYGSNDGYISNHSRGTPNRGKLHWWTKNYEWDTHQEPRCLTRDGHSGWTRSLPKQQNTPAK